MKLNYLKKGLFATLTLSLLSSAAQSGKDYADVFTQDIYDQSSLQPSYQNKAAKKAAILELLRQKKEEALKEKCLKSIKDKIAVYENEYNLAVRGSIASGAINVATNVVSRVAEIVVSFIPIVGLPLRDLIRSFGEHLGQPLSQATLREHFPDNHASSMYLEMLKLNGEMREWVDGLDNEPVKDLEKKYVIKKEKIKSEELRREIEKGLIEARKSDYIAAMTYQFLDRSLNLPLRAKPLMHTRDVDTELCKFLTKFKENPRFQNYDPKLRKKIERIITGIVSDSMAEDNSSISKRDILYFWGDASAGKSDLGREMARFLGLPYYERTARSVSEFTQENIEGADRLMPTPNPGWLADALMETTSPEKLSYKNGFLIINDLHTILEEPIIFNFLLDFLDPQKQNYINNYFRSKVDISRLNIIITSNCSLPSDKKYDALRTRISKSIEFPKFLDSVVKKILNDELKTLCVHMHIPKIFSFEYDDPTKLSIKYNQTLVQLYEVNDAVSDISQTLSKSSFHSLQPEKFFYDTGVCTTNKYEVTLRELKTILKNTMSCFKTRLLKKGMKWLGEANKQNTTVENKIKLYKQAAFVGNPIARLKLAQSLEITNSLLAKAWYAQIVLARNFKSFENHDVLLNAIIHDADLRDIMIRHEELSDTPFHVAAREGERDILSALLKLFPDGAALKGEEDNTPILTAATHGHLNLVELLHPHPATIESNVHKQTALQVAQIKSRENVAGNNNHLEIIKFLLQNKPELIKNFKEDKHLKHDLLKQVEEIANTDHTRYSKALKTLGDIYAQGLGVYSNREKAYEYYKKAVNGGNESFTLDYDMHLLSIDNTRKVCTSNSSDGVTWQNNRQINANWQARQASGYSADTISAVTFRKRSYVATIGRPNELSPDYNMILLKSYADNQQLQGPRETDLSLKAAGGVSLASFEGKLYLSYIGTDWKVWISSSSNGSRWDNPITPNENWRSSYQTSSLTNFKGQLYLAHAGEYHDRGIWLSSSTDGEKWEKATNIIKSLKANISKTAICLTSFKDKLYLGYLGGAYYWGNCGHTPQNMWLTSSRDLGKTWEEPINIMQQITTNRISLTSFKDKLYFAYRNRSNGRIRFTSSVNGQDWLELPDSERDSSGQFCLAPLLKVTPNNTPR